MMGYKQPVIGLVAVGAAALSAIWVFKPSDRFSIAPTASSELSKETESIISKNPIEPVDVRSQPLFDELAAQGVRR